MSDPHIQIGAIEPRTQFTVTAGTQNGPWSYTFPIFKSEDLEVYYGDTLKTLTTHYTVTGAGNSNGGSVTPVSGQTPAVGTVVTIRRRLAIERTSDFQESGAFRAKVINDELDYLTAALQQVADDQKRSVQLGPTAETLQLELNPEPDAVVGWNSSGDGLITIPPDQFQGPTGPQGPPGTGNVSAPGGVTTPGNIPTWQDNVGNLDPDGVALGALATRDSVGAAQIDNGSVGAAEIATHAVGTAEIVDGAVTASKLDPGLNLGGKVLQVKTKFDYANVTLTNPSSEIINHIGTGLIVVPESDTSNLLVMISYSAAHNTGSSGTPVSKMYVQHYSGSAYQIDTRDFPAMYLSVPTALTGNLQNRTNGVVSRSLTPAERRSDTGAWLTRFGCDLGSSSPSGTRNLTFYQHAIMAWEYEP